MILLYQTAHRGIAFLLSFIMRIEGTSNINNKLFASRELGPINLARNVANFKYYDPLSSRKYYNVESTSLSGVSYKTNGLAKNKIKSYVGLASVISIGLAGAGIIAAIVEFSPPSCYYLDCRSAPF